MNRVLVTGANRGIGLELCRQLSTRGDEPVAVCRQSSAALEALNIQVIEGIDVAVAEGAKALSSHLADLPLDWLINNAGILSVSSLDNLDFEGMERQFRVNTLGPLRITSALLPNLSAGSKVGIVTSRMGSIDDIRWFLRLQNVQGGRQYGWHEPVTRSQRPRDCGCIITSRHGRHGDDRHEGNSTGKGGVRLDRTHG